MAQTRKHVVLTFVFLLCKINILARTEDFYVF